MNIIIREHNENDIAAMAEIWNGVVEEGVAFPQTETLSDEEAAEFFASIRLAVAKVQYALITAFFEALQ